MGAFLYWLLIARPCVVSRIWNWRVLDGTARHSPDLNPIPFPIACNCPHFTLAVLIGERSINSVPQGSQCFPSPHELCSIVVGVLTMHMKPRKRFIFGWSKLDHLH